jgi:excisionase family DNA binding protein
MSLAASCRTICPAIAIPKGYVMTTESTRFLTVFEVAVILRVSKATVYHLVHAGDLEAIRVGRAFRIPVRALLPQAPPD